MASLSDICNGLVGLAVQSVYPNGTAQPSVANKNIKAFEGWPVAEQLDKDLLSDVINISVYPLSSEKNTSRYPTDWQTQSISENTIGITVSGQALVLSGSISTPQNVAIIVNNQSFVYAVQSSDTLTTIATGLASIVSASIVGVTSNSAVVNFPPSALIETAQVGGGGTLIREIRRQQRDFQITVWANNPSVREIVATTIDIAFAKQTFITLPDMTSARMVYKGSPQTDNFQKVGLYRRDFIYTIEFATTETQASTEILVVQQNISNVQINL
jgi:hypothetical protein